MIIPASRKVLPVGPAPAPAGPVKSIQPVRPLPIPVPRRVIPIPMTGVVHAAESNPVFASLSGISAGISSATAHSYLP